MAQGLTVHYAYDAVGNRVRVNDQAYTYDANNRMLSAYDGENETTIANVQYDAYGNRTSQKFADAGGAVGKTVTYTYNHNNLVENSSAGDAWQYDSRGNTTRHDWEGGQYTTSGYDALGRATTSFSHTQGDDGKFGDSTTRSYFDAAGNLYRTYTEGDGYHTTELTSYDIHYRNTAKDYDPSNSNADGASHIYGATRYDYDVNGNLIRLDRGYNKDAGHNNIGLYSYDNEGKIIGKTDRGDTGLVAGTIWRYADDPTATDEYSYESELDRLQAAYTKDPKLDLSSYLYANGQVVGERTSETTVALKYLSLTADFSWNEVDAEGYVTATHYGVTVKNTDIAYNADGSVNRPATAYNMAARVFKGGAIWGATSFNSLSSTGKNAIASALMADMPGAIAVGTPFGTSRYLVVADASAQTNTVIIDNIYQRIGGDEGLPGGSAMSHTVNPGETLQSIAASYFGSASYWYLIAEANGLQGTEELKAGTTLTIPNTAANSVNDKDTYKVYSQSEIIGSESPEVRVQQKKRSWWQQLVAVLIAILVIAVSIWVATVVGPQVFQGTTLLVGSALGGGVVGLAVGATVGLAAAAVAGYAVGVATSLVTQTIAVAADLQEEVRWEDAVSMGKDLAISSMAGGLTSWINAYASTSTLGQVGQYAARGFVEYQKQRVKSEDGKVSNITGVLAGMFKFEGAGVAAVGAIEQDIRFKQSDGKEGAALGLGTLVSIVGAGLTTDKVLGEGITTDGLLDWGKVAAESLYAAANYAAAWNDSKGNYDAAAQAAGGVLGGAIASSQFADGWAQAAWENIKSGASRVGQAISDGLAAVGSAIVESVNEMAGMFDEPATQVALAGAGASAASGAGTMAAAPRMIGGVPVDKYGRMLGPDGRPVMLADASGGLGALEGLYAGDGGDGSDTTAGQLGQGAASDSASPRTVQSGQSMWSIAKTDLAQELGREPTDAEVLQRTQQIMEVNQGIDPRSLKPGDVLNMPVAGQAVSDRAVADYNQSDADYRGGSISYVPGISAYGEMRAAPEPGFFETVGDIWDNPYQPRIEKLRSTMQLLFAPSQRDAERVDAPFEWGAIATGALKEVGNAGLFILENLAGGAAGAPVDLGRIELSDAEKRGAAGVQALSWISGLGAAGRGERVAAGVVPNSNPSQGVRFFGEQDLKYFTAENATLGNPNGAAFFMPVEDAALIRNTSDALRYTGNSPSILKAQEAGSDIYGISFPTKGLEVRQPTSVDAGGWPHFLEGGNTAVRLPDPNGGFLVNPTREFVTPGSNTIPEGTVLFKLGPNGEWIPKQRF